MNRLRAKQTALAVILIGISTGVLFGPWEGIGLTGIALLVDGWLPESRRGGNA